MLSSDRSDAKQFYLSRVKCLCVSEASINHVALLHIYDEFRLLNSTEEIKESDLPITWDIKSYRRILDKTLYTVDISSIQGAETYRATKIMYYQENDAFLLFFNDAASLEKLLKWHEEIKRHNENALFYLINIADNDKSEKIKSSRIAEIETICKMRRRFDCPSFNPNRVCNMFNAIFNDAANQLFQKPTLPFFNNHKTEDDSNKDKKAIKKCCFIM